MTHDTPPACFAKLELGLVGHHYIYKLLTAPIAMKSEDSSSWIFVICNRFHDPLSNEFSFHLMRQERTDTTIQLGSLFRIVVDYLPLLLVGQRFQLADVTAFLVSLRHKCQSHTCFAN